MAWSVPLTAATGAGLSAAQWNASVRDNLLETAAAKATTSGAYFTATGPNALAERIAAADTVSATETTTSSAFANLTTGGPAVTITSGAKALVMTSCAISNNTANVDSFMGMEVSGATTISPTDSASLINTSATANARINASYVALYSLTAGSNTFTAKYRVQSGTGTFGVRRITVLPF